MIAGTLTDRAIMERPKLLPTSATDESFAGVTYHLDGELVPALTVELPQSGATVYFEHHVVLWKHPMVDIGIRPMKGALKRMMAGMQIFVTEAKGPGQIPSVVTDRGTSSRFTSSPANRFTSASISFSPPPATSTTPSSA